jgi:hypothetical protein
MYLSAGRWSQRKVLLATWAKAVMFVILLETKVAESAVTDAIRDILKLFEFGWMDRLVGQNEILYGWLSYVTNTLFPRE